MDASNKSSVAILIGVVVGFILATIFAGGHTGEQGIFPSIVFQVNDTNIHLHHWLVASFLFIAIKILTWKKKIIKHCPLLFFIDGLLVGLVIQGVIMYDDWYIMVY